MPNILVTGAASGVGKAFVIAFLEDQDNIVCAVDKDFQHHALPPSDGVEVCDGGLDGYPWDICHNNEPSGRLKKRTVDVADEHQVTQLANQPALRDIDLVIHSVGIRGLVHSVPIAQGSDVAKAETMDAMTVQTMQDTFNVNTVGTFLLLRALVPKLRPGGNAKIVIMGSRMGSVGHNTIGGGYAYRASKAALNAVVKSFSVDVPEVMIVIVHPGRVESNLVGKGVTESGALTAEESVRDMLGLIQILKRKDSGRFVDRWGGDIPW